MKKRNLFIIAFIALIGVAFIFNACKKEDDTTPPVVKLTGNATYDIVLNSSAVWADPGATATDDKDGDVSSSIKITGGPIDNNLAKEYTLTYTATDAAGNSGNATRKITVYNAAKDIAGTYSVIDVANGVTSTYTENVTASVTVNNKINFAKFGNYSNGGVYANVTGNTITIPTQIVNCGSPTSEDHTFSGSGTFTSTSITINYVDTYSFGTFNCTGTYSR